MSETGVRVAFVALAVFGYMTLGLIPAQASGDEKDGLTQRVVLTLGSEDNKKRLFHPERLILKARERYTLVIENPSFEVHEFDSPGLVEAAWSSSVKVLDGIGETALPVAKIVGKLAEVEIFPGNSIEWTFVPVVTGSYDVLCDIEDQSGKTHTEMGMKGTIVVE